MDAYRNAFKCVLLIANWRERRVMVIIVYIKVTKCYQIMNVYKHNFGYLEVVRYHNNP